MTDFMLVRHGTPDYSYINGKKFRGFGNDLAPLTEDGEKEAIAISMAPELQDADLILSSPHTRTLQTAAIIAKELDIKLIVEVDLMEWIADKTFMYDDYNQVVKWREHYEQNDGKNMYPGDNFETKDELREYVDSQKSIVDGDMREGIVFRSLDGTRSFKCVSPAYLMKYHS